MLCRVKQRAYNQQAAAMLESLAAMYTVAGGEGNGWRERGFKKAATVLRGLGTEITDVGQLRVRSEARAHCYIIGVFIVGLSCVFFPAFVPVLRWF